MAKIYNISRESNGGKIGLPELINVYYTALMIFLVFTAGNDIFKGIQKDFHWELIFYLFLWLSMVIQTTFAYKHIKEIPPKNYNMLAFISDSIDICIFIFVCAAIGNTYKADSEEFKDMSTYWYISIPFLILSINQFFWYMFVREKKFAAAVLRLILLFAVMLTVTILDVWFHNSWLLLGILVGNATIMVGLRAGNKAPKSFEDKIKGCWKKVKKTAVVKWLLERIDKLDKIESIEEMAITVEAEKDKIDTK